mmetsp:Transcript_33200/g.80270  ORF Transcript_33200/g.80270 Transcript_33200/m.80270 type:complete len:85 (+) Transcript_33200:1778-2032(+)
MIFGKDCGRTYGGQPHDPFRLGGMFGGVQSIGTVMSCLPHSAVSVPRTGLQHTCTLLENLQIQASRAVSMEKGIKDHQVESTAR